MKELKTDNGIGNGESAIAPGWRPLGGAAAEPRVRPVLVRIAEDCRETFAENLMGIYLHGSLALGCFNWDKSDIDFIIVTRDAPALDEKEAFLRRMLALDPICPEKGLETSLVLERHCREFRYPTPYELHFSNAHKQRCREDIRAYCAATHGADKDLAAHFTILKKAGITLFGKPKEDVFGEVPEADYRDSIRCDVKHAAEEILLNPMYMILSLCRVLAYVEEGRVLSKKQGADWGRSNLPERYAPLIWQAAECYGGLEPFSPGGAEALLSGFAEHMLGRIFAEPERAAKITETLRTD